MGMGSGAGAPKGNGVSAVAPPRKMAIGTTAPRDRIKPSMLPFHYLYPLMHMIKRIMS